MRQEPVATGVEGLIGEHGRVRSGSDGVYKVFVHGELWRALSDDSLQPDAAVEVTAVEGLTLTVRSVASGGGIRTPRHPSSDDATSNNSSSTAAD